MKIAIVSTMRKCPKYNRAFKKLSKYIRKNVMIFISVPRLNSGTEGEYSWTFKVYYSNFTLLSFSGISWMSLPLSSLLVVWSNRHRSLTKCKYLRAPVIFTHTFQFEALVVKSLDVEILAVTPITLIRQRYYYLPDQTPGDTGWWLNIYIFQPTPTT